MRNLKRALSLALASVMLLGMMVVGTSAAGYPDVDAQDNLEAIEVMKLLGVMSGDDNGNFNPDKNVTRNEMAVIMTHLLKLNVGGTTPFTDVPAWAQPYVAACYVNGVVAGTSATTFGGNDNVTATQAALMVMKALGYFQFQGEFKNDWQLAVVTQAQRIGLFTGISAQVNAPLTRNEAAQLCLNALEANVKVVEEQGGASFTDGNTSFVMNATYKYDNVASTKAKDYRTNPTDQDEAQQLIEKLFGTKVQKNGTVDDEFGRKCSKWTYSGKDVKAAQAPDLTYTAEVKVKDIYKDLGLDATKTATVKLDGVDQPNVNITKDGGALANSGNGVLVEVYKVTDNQGVLQSLKIAMIKTYCGEVTKVTPAKGNDKATVTVDGKTYETEAFKLEDKVLYTKANNVIKTMTPAVVADAGKVTGTSTKNGATTFTIGGTNYKFAASYVALDNKTVVVKGEYDLYLDAYGYVVATKETKGADAQYAYVMGTKTDGFTGSISSYAKLLLADGTIVEAKLNKDGVTTGLDGKVVSYTVKDDVYKIATAQTATNVTKITKGSASLNGKDVNGNPVAVAANAKTAFVVRTGKTDEWTYTAYTGINNVPSMETIADGNAIAFVDSGVAKFVYVVNTDEKGTEASKPVFILAAGMTTNKDADNNTYYTYKAVVDGEVTEVASTRGDLAVQDDALGTLYSSVIYNSDNRISNGTTLISKDNGARVDKFNAGTEKTKDGLVTLCNTVNGQRVKYNLGYSDSVQVFVIDTDNNISVSSVSAIQADNNDVVHVAYTNKDDKIISAIYIFEVANG